MGAIVIRAKVFRYSPGEKKETLDTFEVPYTEGMTVQILLRSIYENIDPTLAFRDFRCGQGICNTCRIKVNGRAVRSCETLVRPGEEILLEPANDEIIKDLVTQPDKG